MIHIPPLAMTLCCTHGWNLLRSFLFGVSTNSIHDAIHYCIIACACDKACTELKTVVDGLHNFIPQGLHRSVADATKGSVPL